MPRMDKTEKDWNGLKLGFLKTIQPNSVFTVDPCCLQLQKIMLGRHICLSGTFDFVIDM